MKSVVLFAGLSFAVFSFAGSFAQPAIAQTATFTAPSRASELAPADAYFGRFRMSILGMRNAIKDVTLRIDRASSDELATLYHKLSIVEDAMVDLKDQYPNDTWLPQLGLSLAQGFFKFPMPGAQAHANQNLDWVIADFPGSDQAFYAHAMRYPRVGPVVTRIAPVVTMDVPVEPTLPSSALAAPSPAEPLPSYAVPLPR